MFATFQGENKDKPMDTDYVFLDELPKLILLIISKSIPCLIGLGLIGLGLIGYWATFGQKWRKNSILINYSKVWNRLEGI